jgi:surfeit locus 1 family protein
MAEAQVRRQFAFTLFCIAAFVLACGLGTWQVQRLGWKRDLIATIEARRAQPPVRLPAEFGDPEDWNFRAVRVSGRYRHDQEQFLGPRSYKSQSGFHVLTPFSTADGRQLLVNRGWVPAEREGWERRTADESEGAVSLTGYLRTGFARGAFTPDHDARARLWYWYDLDGLAKETGLDLLPVVLEITEPSAGPGGLPIAAASEIDLPNNHLQYAITWYGLAAVVLVMYGFWYRRRA